MREFIITENDADQRVDKFIAKTLKTMPKSLMYKYIRNKKIKVNRKRCEISQRLMTGDTMQCFIAEEFFEEEKNYDFLKVVSTLNILYEDDNVLIVDKEKGLLAHRDQSGVQDNLEDRILHYLYQNDLYTPETAQSFKPALCHRIDRNTRGIVIAAKNAASLREMNEHIRNHEVCKKYICIVEGAVTKQKEHVVLYHKKMDGNKADIKKEPSEGYKPMESIYRVLSKGKQYTLLEVEIMSGKSHQIRAMMSYLHHPLVGDVKYGASKNGKKGYQELCAYRVEFNFHKKSGLHYLDGKIFELRDNDITKLFHRQYQ